MAYIHRQNERPKPMDVLKNPLHLLAAGLGSGLSSRAPGTLGSLVAVVVYELSLAHIPVFWQLLVVLIAFITGIYLCGKTAADWQSPDHSSIVWDEWAAQWLVLALLPNNIISVIAGFLLFRLFDIWKPWPVSWIDRHVHGGFGIMLDDIAAAGIAVAVFWLSFFALGQWSG